MRLEFKNVGRNRLSWVADVRELDYSEIVKAIREKKALMSRGIDFGEEDSMTHWFPIYAGMQLVGSFRVLEPSP